MFFKSINFDPICQPKELEEKDSSRLFGQRPGAKVAMVAGVQPSEVFFKLSPIFVMFCECSKIFQGSLGGVFQMLFSF